ncbi:MAG TPA: SusC/RagA family TonB-linked outer membrane protein, partial [Prolixibacteraceae bacterium]|nr:SusC/RagA family TonB-linked outer membrane protein [Prolixibacteraceae bacterium]
MRKLSLLLVFLFMAGLQVVVAQTRLVTGNVTSAEDRSPVPGASVVVKGTTVGTVTDSDGNFSLNVPQNAQTLVISFVGMVTQEVPVSSQVRVLLESETQLIDEVISVAYGTAKKSSFTGSASSVSSDKLETRSVATITKALDGIVPGVQSTLGSGQPGDGASIVIRGFGSINASTSPLYVVDGVPYNGALNAINPNDIESITILKDASAGALYGSRGANGVVMITTKAGKDTSGKISTNFKASLGLSSRAIPRYNVMNQSEYLETAFLAFKHDEMFAKGIPEAQAGLNAIARMRGTVDGILGVNEQYNPYNMPLAELIDPVTGKVNPSASLKWTDNWLDEVTAENPLRQEYQMDVSGGTIKTKALASVNYMKEDGLLKTTSFDRMTGRLSVDHKTTDWFRMGMSANFALSKTNYLGATGSATSNIWYSAEQMAPIFPIWERDENGQIKKDALGVPLFDYGMSRPSGAQINFNSIAVLYDDKYLSNSDNVSGRSLVEFNTNNEKYGFAQGFTFTMNLGFDHVGSSSTTYYNPYFGNAGGTVKGRLSKSHGRTFSYTFNQILNWNRTFGSHNFDLMGGHEYYHYKYNSISASKTGFPFGGLYELASGSTIASASSYENNDALESYFSRLNYNFADRYYFSASYRTDGSSHFHKDFRWGDFWSVGASWRVSEEAFMDGVTWVDNLTLKASFGTQGNNAVGLYAWQSFYDLTYNNAGLNGAVVTSLENKEVSWEKNENLNVGLEGRFFDRLNLGVEWYTRKTTDMLLYRPMATSLGFNGFYDNIGDMKNTGFDITASYDIIKTKDFLWSVNAMGSTVKNEVLKLTDEQDEIISGTTIIR